MKTVRYQLNEAIYFIESYSSALLVRIFLGNSCICTTNSCIHYAGPMQFFNMTCPEVHLHTSGNMSDIDDNNSLIAAPSCGCDMVVLEFQNRSNDGIHLRYERTKVKGVTAD